MVPQLQAEQAESLSEEWLRPIIKGWLKNPNFKSMSSTVKYLEAKRGTPLSNQEVEDLIVNDFSQGLFSKRSLTSKNLPGSTTTDNKTKNKYPLPQSTDVQATADLGYYNVSTNESKTPTSFSAAKEFAKTYNRENYLSKLLEENNVSLGTPQEHILRIKGIVGRNSDLNPNQLKQALLSAGVDESKADLISNDLSQNIFSLESQKNNLEQSIDYTNRKAAEGLNLNYNSKTKEYESKAGYDVLNNAQLKANQDLKIIKNSLNEAKIAGKSIIDLSYTVNNYGSSRAQEVLDEWKSIESSLNLPSKIELTGALANPNSQESKDLIAKYTNGLVLESLYTDRFYEAIKTDKTINYLRELDPEYGKYFQNREDLWSNLHKQTQMGLDIYDLDQFGKIKGGESSGQTIKKIVGANLDNYEFYNHKNIKITDDILSKKDNKINLQKAVDEGNSVLVSDPYNGRFLLKVMTGDPTESGKVKRGDDSSYAYIDITDDVEKQVNLGIIPKEFLQDFNFTKFAWDEIKQLGVGDKKSLNDIVRQSNAIYDTKLNKDLEIQRDNKNGYYIKGKDINIYNKNKKELLSNINQIIKTSEQFSSTLGGDGMGKQNFFSSRMP